MGEEAKKIRVLVVDDSALMRKKISNIINSDDRLEVVGTADNGEEAIKEVLSHNPDVITMDISMPKMDGLTALGYIMSEHPTPVIIVSAYLKEGGSEIMTALEYGAVDFVKKPGSVVSLKIDKVRDELIEKIKLAAGVDPKKIRLKLFSGEKKEKIFIPPVPAGKLVVIGASTGGPKALVEILPGLPKDFSSAVIVVQHMPPEFTGSFAERLNSLSNLPVKEAKENDPIETGKILLAPGDFHLCVHPGEKGCSVKLNKGPKVNSIRPSISVTMQSAAPVYREKCVGVLLTGMGYDGVDGLFEIKKFGGKTIVEHESTAMINGMPGAAVKAGIADRVLPLYDIPSELVSMTNGK